MSALTEQVAREHEQLTGPWCLCGEHLPYDATYAKHVAEVTEAATRAAVAAEIDSVGHHWSGAPALAFFALADDIREGVASGRPHR